MEAISNTAVLKVFDEWPRDAREKLLQLRHLILQVAKDSEDIGDIEETLKWGEPSYLCKTGSTIRISYSHKDPQNYGMYFNCKTKLVETFREVYADEFRFDGNRALMFHIDDDIPSEALSHCIYVALRYHRCKSLPLLGM